MPRAKRSQNFQDMDKKAPIVVVPTVARCGVGRCFTGGSVHCTLCTGCFHYKVTPAINQSRGNETTPGEFLCFRRYSEKALTTAFLLLKVS